MINHYRTWLGNISAASSPLAGEEFIDPDFRPVPARNFPQDLRNVRNLLFGVSPTRDSVNVRLAVYGLVWQQAGLHEDVIKQHPDGITYELDGSGIWGSDITEQDLQHNIATILQDLDNVPSRFFSSREDLLRIWLDTNQSRIMKLGTLLLMTAYLTEQASGVSNLYETVAAPVITSSSPFLLDNFNGSGNANLTLSDSGHTRRVWGGLLNLSGSGYLVQDTNNSLDYPTLAYDDLPPVNGRVTYRVTMSCRDGNSSPMFLFNTNFKGAMSGWTLNMQQGDVALHLRHYHTLDPIDYTGDYDYDVLAGITVDNDEEVEITILTDDDNITVSAKGLSETINVPSRPDKTYGGVGFFFNEWDDYSLVHKLEIPNAPIDPVTPPDGSLLYDRFLIPDQALAGTANTGQIREILTGQIMVEQNTIYASSVPAILRYQDLVAINDRTIKLGMTTPGFTNSAGLIFNADFTGNGTGWMLLYNRTMSRLELYSCTGLGLTGAFAGTMVDSLGGISANNNPIFVTINGDDVTFGLIALPTTYQKTYSAVGRTYKAQTGVAVGFYIAGSGRNVKWIEIP